MNLAVIAEIPEWLKSNVDLFCKYCSTPLVDDYVLENGVKRYTQRYCANPKCPGHMAARIEGLAKYFKVPGIAFQTALQYVTAYKLENHLQVIPMWFRDVKPVLYLHEIAKLSYIYGVNDEWKDIVKGYSSFEEYFSDRTLLRPVCAEANKEYLLYCEQFFTVKRAISANTMYVMLTGSFYGYQNREDLLNELNEQYGDVIHIFSCGKAKKASYLVKEVGASDHSKSYYAAQQGIPVVTPAMLKQVISNYADRVRS